MSDDQIPSNSLNVSETKLQKLKEILPEAFSEGRIDTDKLKMALGEQFFVKDEHYELGWAGKTDAFITLQQPTTATLAPAEPESVNFDDTENIFIEGENLETLKILQKSYFGKIKMIYIDPPYNTGSDSFIYPDKFSESKEEYLKRIGSKDEEGYLTKDGFFRKNSRDNGHYHSNWLSMMYPRLYLARNLLRDDGVIFVSIDDNEVHNLRAVMNEIFGEENFVSQFVWRSRLGKGGTAEQVAKIHEYILMYAKVIQELSVRKDVKIKGEGKERLRQWGQGDKKEDRPSMFYPIKGPNDIEVFPIKSDGSEGRWRVGKVKMQELISKNLVTFTQREDGLFEAYKIIEEGKESLSAIDSIISMEEVSTTAHGSKELKSLFDDIQFFDYPKPFRLIKYLSNLIISNNSIILDFFSGSGTTAQAVLELNKEDGGNRKFICVQLPEKTEEDSEAHKAGYKTIADIGKERIRRVILNTQKEKADKPELFNDKNIDLGFKVFKLKRSNFKLWRGDIIENEDDLKAQMDAFENPKMEGAKEFNILYELMLKTGCTLSDKVDTKENYYAVNNGELIVAAKAINESVIKNIINDKPKKVIILDELFENNDQLKTNTALQMKDAGIEFRTV